MMIDDDDDDDLYLMIVIMMVNCGFITLSSSKAWVRARVVCVWPHWLCLAWVSRDPAPCS